MRLLSAINNWMRHPSYFILSLENHGLLQFIPDKLMLRYVYRVHLHKKLNLKNPESFNEKIQWLKLKQREDLYTQMVDKYEVKSIVESRIGKEHVIPVLGIWNDAESIDYDILPQKFVLKVTHDSGGVVICKDKTTLNKEKVTTFFNKKMKHSLYWGGREWPYKNVPHRIFAEEYLENIGTEVLVVYKVLCFNRKPQIIQVIQDDKTEKETIDYFDTEWNLLPFKQNHPNSLTHIEKPMVLQEMLDLTNKLLIDIPFLRVDWYIVNNKLYFSEFTFYSDNGFAPFYPEIWDYKLGKMITL